MCFGIPGLIVELVDAEKQVGRVEVSGITRTIHFGLLEAEEVQSRTGWRTVAVMTIARCSTTAWRASRTPACVVCSANLPVPCHTCA